MKQPRRPGDFNQQAKLIVDLATGHTTQADIDLLPPMGKEIGGHARTKAVAPEHRREIARMGGQAKAARA